VSETHIRADDISAHIRRPPGTKRVESFPGDLPAQVTSLLSALCEERNALVDHLSGKVS